MARPRFSPLLVLHPLTWTTEAEQRLHVKEFIIQKMSRGLSISQIRHQELIFSLALILPLVQRETAIDYGAFIKEIFHLISMHHVNPSLSEKMKFISRSYSEVQDIC